MSNIADIAIEDLHDMLSLFPLEDITGITNCLDTITAMVDDPEKTPSLKKTFFKDLQPLSPNQAKCIAYFTFGFLACMRRTIPKKHSNEPSIKMEHVPKEEDVLNQV